MTVEALVTFVAVAPAIFCACSNKSNFSEALHFRVVYTNQQNFKYCTVEPLILPTSTHWKTGQTNLHAQKNSAVTGQMQ